MGMPGIYELVIIFGVAILFFGGKKLPGLGSALGESIRNFKSGLKEGAEDTEKSKDIAPAKASDITEKDVV
jgi:sec-independent protein translocase protein TatA